MNKIKNFDFASNLNLLNLDFIKKYHPEVTNYSKIVGMIISEVKTLNFSYEGIQYTVPLKDYNETIDVLNFLDIKPYGEDEMSLYFRTKKGEIFTLSVEDIPYLTLENSKKIKEILDNN